MTRKELLEAAIKTVTEDRQDRMEVGTEPGSDCLFWTTYICAANPALTSSSAVATWLL